MTVRSRTVGPHAACVVAPLSFPLKRYQHFLADHRLLQASGNPQESDDDCLSDNIPENRM